MGSSLKWLILFLICLPVITVCHQPIFNVVDNGAIGNGRTDDTNAFVKAWEKICASSSSPVMRVPSKKTFLIQPLQFIGPCKSRTITVEIDGNLVAPTDPSKWKCNANVCHQWIYFHQVDGLTLRGRGIIDGRGQKWWQNTVLEISNSKNVELGGGLRFKDSPMMHVAFNGINWLLVSNLTIEAPENSPNTDGIHIQECTNAHIQHCTIGTGDDCIAIVHGSSSIRIRNIICGPGHGISIGSLGKYGAEDKVEDVRVSDVVFLGTKNGARIKTWQGGRGYARDIHFERCLFHETMNPIIIDQFYCDHQRCKTSKLGVEISNVSYKMMVGNSKRENA
ncbi:hypothetical protein C2S51_035523, partial [Perilla frutescens var. frutescens]